MARQSLAYAIMAGGVTLVITAMLHTLMFGPIVDEITGQEDWRPDPATTDTNATVQKHANAGQGSVATLWKFVPGFATLACGVMVLRISRGGV